MSLILKYYDKIERREYCWYSSSNVYCSWVEDVEDDFKELYVVFNHKQCYHYKKVDVRCYLNFSRGSLDGSIGKALNQFIKPKYECEKLENFDLRELENKKNEIMKEQNDLKVLQGVAMTLFEIKDDLIDNIGALDGKKMNDEQGSIIYKLINDIHMITEDFITQNQNNNGLCDKLFVENNSDIISLMEEHFGCQFEHINDQCDDINRKSRWCSEFDMDGYIAEHGDQ